MKLNTYSLYKYLFLSLLTTIVASPAILAYPLDTYAEHSRLSEGQWVKISVDKTGIYQITNTQLAKMGFSEPSKVWVYGYGADRLPEQMTLADFRDDLPPVTGIRTSSGIIFYGVGPDAMKAENEATYRYPAPNPFTTAGYYYVGEASDPSEMAAPKASGTAGAASPATTFYDTAFYQLENVSIGQTGHALFGDNLFSSRAISINMPGIVSGESVRVRVSYAFGSPYDNTSMRFLVNGANANPDNTLLAAVTDSNVYYRLRNLYHTVAGNTSDQVSVQLSFSSKHFQDRAYLHFITATYTRSLNLSSGQLAFRLSAPAGAVGGATSSSIVWDVTDPHAPLMVNTAFENGRMVFTSDYASWRDYVAFDTAATLPAPDVVGNVKPQDLHSLSTPDMVIFTPSQWIAQAERLADVHRNGPEALSVEVVDQDLVFEEFASGSRDVQAFRRMLKMLYDRDPDKLQYCLMFGKGIHDNRRLTAAAADLGPLMPIWESDGGSTETESYTTDDIFAFLRDDSGAQPGNEPYHIAVGRLPVMSVNEAKTTVDKIIEYREKMEFGSWRTRVLMMIDNGDNGVHLTQGDTMQGEMAASDGGRALDYKKVYFDAYEEQGGTLPQARADILKALNDGVAWWTYIGHASTTTLSSENVITYEDLNTMYLRHYPVMYAATCSFLRWDSPTRSGAETAWVIPNGGPIAVISAVRPVYISDNGVLSKAVGKHAFRRNPDGTLPTIGQIVTRAKNDSYNSSTGMLKIDTNKLRYVLLGDPAMYPVIPERRVVLTAINGVDLSDPDAQPVLQAYEQATMEGYIADETGALIPDYCGIVSSTIYDAEESVVTETTAASGQPVTFDRQGARIFAGNDSITDGRFTIHVAMPSNIANNFRPAAVNLYARTSDKGYRTDAAGCCRDFYVFGEDTSVDDTTPPGIRSMYLNHPTFRTGDVVNDSPMFIADVSDNIGLNMSVAGVGRQMTLMLDGKTNYADVCDYFTPSFSEASSGTIAYPLSNLTEGPHTLTLRVWDTFDNSASQTIDFYVNSGQAPTLFDIYSDANPATTEANFYLTHNRPDQTITVTISVYDLRGRQLWSNTSSARSDMYLSAPVNWDLRDNSGRRVPRGIYLYRASISCDGVESSTRTKRLAIAAQ